MQEEVDLYSSMAASVTNYNVESKAMYGLLSDMFPLITKDDQYGTLYQAIPTNCDKLSDDMIILSTLYDANIMRFLIFQRVCRNIM